MNIDYIDIVLVEFTNKKSSVEKLQKMKDIWI